VIGSIAPDVAYCFGALDIDTFSHTLLGTFVFCIPAGWLLILVCRGIREPLVSLLPNPHRDALLPLCRSAGQPLWVTTASILIGAWTHIFLDGFTHWEGWCTLRFDVLRAQVALVAGYEAPVYRILWYGFSLAGLLWLGGSYVRWLKANVQTARVWPVQEKRRYGIWALALTLPYLAIVPFTIHLAEDRPLIYGLHRFVHDSFTAYLIVVALLLLVLGFGLRLRASRLRAERKI